MWRGALSGVLSAIALLGANGAGRCAQAPDPRSEEFPALDPYTRAEPAALKRAGCVSLGPFTWCRDVETSDVERALGEPRVLWLETAHFRLGSTLESYKSGADRIEKAKLEAELERLGRRLARVPKEAARLDPWLRLHLLAQRCEEQYAEFQARFGLRAEDYQRTGAYLGMGSKFSVLLTERTATLARFLERVAKQPAAANWRGELPGDTLFLGQSAEGLREHNYELDAALHCALAADLAVNLVKGTCGYHESTPAWFTCGLASWFSRRVDARWTIYATGTTLLFGDDSWDWAPRVRRIVGNGLGASWSEMLDWPDWNAIDAQGHMLLWSRVDWMLSRKDADPRALLLGFGELGQSHAVQERVLVRGLGAGSAELDARWREFVLRGSPRK